MLGFQPALVVAACGGVNLIYDFRLTVDLEVGSTLNFEF